MKGIKKVGLMLLLVGALTGCGNVVTNETPKNKAPETSSQQMDTSEDQISENTSTIGDGILFETETFTLNLPASWEGKYVTHSEQEEGVDISYVAFFEKGCYEENEAGWLFSIGMYPDDMYLEQPSYEIIKKHDGITYVAIYPSDVQTEGASKEAGMQYTSLVKDVETVVKTLQVH